MDLIYCAASTRSGAPCRNRARVGSLYCHVHQRHASKPGRYETIVPAAASVATGELDQEGLAGGRSAPLTGEQDPARNGAGNETSDVAALRAQLRADLDRLVKAVKEKAPPGYQPPPFEPRQLIKTLESLLAHFSPEQAMEIIKRLQASLGGPGFDLQAWQNIWYVVNFAAQYQVDMVRRRFTGEYEVDPYGFDQEIFALIKPLFSLFYKYFWRVEVSGIEHVPAYGRAMMVANHSGVLPFDGAMVMEAIWQAHPAPRLTRALYLDWFNSLPFVSTALMKTGQVAANPDNTERLLNEDQLVLVFPEGLKGAGKLYKDRYKLARFGRGGFIRTAVRTGAPIFPVAITGAEEIYPMLANAAGLAQLIGFPYFPITPTFPWLGLLGVVPLPSKWWIDFGAAIPTAEYGSEAADDLTLVAELTDRVRNQIQEMLIHRLSKRRSIYLG
ncbi:MAG: acyltransferase family protein [Chloroflexi bacterium]|nr:acyltransferase family protein [Chloroflexota bacterium]